MFNISEEVNSVSSVNAETEEVATESFLYDEYDVYEDFAMEAAVSKKEQKLSNHVADLLKRVTRKVNRFRSVEKLEAYAEKLNAEIEKYNDVLSIMKKLCEKFEDEKIDKATFSAKMKEAQKTLKNQLDILSISDFNGNSKSIGSEEIVALNEFLTGARKIVDARREYLNASEKAESSDAKEGLETPVVEDEVAEEGCTKKKCTESCGECEYTDEDIDMSYNAYEAACKKYCASEGCDKKPLTKREFKIAITNKEIKENKDLRDKILKGQFTKDDLDAMGILKEYDDDNDEDDDDDKKCTGKCKEKEAEEACKSKCAKEACGNKNAEEACVRKNGVKVMSSSDCKKKGGCESFTEFLDSMTIGMEDISMYDTENEVAEEALVSFAEIKRLVVQKYEDAKKLRTTSPADAEKSLISASDTLKSVDEKNAAWKNSMQKKIDTLRLNVAQTLRNKNKAGVTPEDIKIDVNAEKRRFYKVYATAKKQVANDPGSAAVQLQDASEIVRRLKAAGEDTESLEKLLNRLTMKKIRATESIEDDDLDAADIDAENEVAEEGLKEVAKNVSTKYDISKSYNAVTKAYNSFKKPNKSGLKSALAVLTSLAYPAIDYTAGGIKTAIGDIKRAGGLTHEITYRWNGTSGRATTNIIDEFFWHMKEFDDVMMHRFECEPIATYISFAVLGVIGGAAAAASTAKAASKNKLLRNFSDKYKASFMKVDNIYKKVTKVYEALKKESGEEREKEVKVFDQFCKQMATVILNELKSLTSNMKGLIAEAKKNKEKTKEEAKVEAKKTPEEREEAANHAEQKESNKKLASKFGNVETAKESFVELGLSDELAEACAECMVAFESYYDTDLEADEDIELDEDALAEESILNEAFLAGESDIDAADIDAENEVAEEGLGAKIRTSWVVKHGALKKEAALKKKEAAKMVRQKKFDKASEYLEEAIQTLDELDAQIAELDMNQYEIFTPGSGEKKSSYKNYKDDLHNWVIKEKEKITDQISKVQEKQSKSTASESFVKDAFESYLNELGLDADGNEIESVDDDAEMNSALEALNDAELDNVDADIDLELAFDDEDEE